MFASLPVSRCFVRSYRKRRVLFHDLAGQTASRLSLFVALCSASSDSMTLSNDAIYNANQPSPALNFTHLPFNLTQRIEFRLSTLKHNIQDKPLTVASPFLTENKQCSPLRIHLKYNYYVVS